MNSPASGKGHCHGSKRPLSTYNTRKTGQGKLEAGFWCPAKKCPKVSMDLPRVLKLCIFPPWLKR